MNGAGTTKAPDPNPMGASGVTARVRCAACNRIASLGQYPVGSNVCIRCNPKPAGWRRGDFP